MNQFNKDVQLQLIKCMGLAEILENQSENFNTSAFRANNNLLYSKLETLRVTIEDETTKKILKYLIVNLDIDPITKNLYHQTIIILNVLRLTLY